jgi:hypothetical protein
MTMVREIMSRVGRCSLNWGLSGVKFILHALASARLQHPSPRSPKQCRERHARLVIVLRHRATQTLSTDIFPPTIKLHRGHVI